MWLIWGGDCGGGGVGEWFAAGGVVVAGGFVAGGVAGGVGGGWGGGRELEAPLRAAALCFASSVS